MVKVTLIEMDGIRFDIDTGHEHSIDMRGDKPYYEYAFTPYAAFSNSLFNQKGNVFKIGTDETPSMQFKKKELRIKLLQKIYAGHELNEELFIMMGLSRSNSATTINTNSLFWQMVSDMGRSEGDRLPGKDFASLFEKIFYLKREEAWRLSWALVRTAYAEYWPSVDTLLDLASKIPATKNRQRDESYAAFITFLESHISWLKKEASL